MGEYKVSVPLSNRAFRRQGREKLVASLRRLGAERVFLALQADCILPPKRENELAALRENCAYLQAEGFEVGAWLWAFYLSEERGFTRMESPSGKKAKLSVCPSDPAYTREMAAMVADIARCGVSLIMFDDDYRFGFQDMGFGCVCPNHRRRIAELLGREPEDGELADCLLSGGRSAVRDAFIRANGDSLRDFAAAMRRSLDAVAPDVRMGFCACITSWDLDGATPDDISRILAGNTRPFYRLIGAPYWAAMRAWGNCLGSVLEMERSEAARRKDGETEIFCEGDTFPRPRYKTPAAYLEIFDTVMRAARCSDGILKYALDYGADADYETGYEEACVRNAGCYAAIDAMFYGKTCVGVRCYDRPDKYAVCDIPESVAGKDEIQELPFSATARFLSANSVPTVYEGEGVAGAAFGCDALDAPAEAMKKGLIIDAAAARLLTQRGVDVGVISFGESFSADCETHADGGPVAIFHPAEAVRLEVAPGAEILSYAEVDGERLPLSYAYENADGQRFLVYAMQGYFAPQDWFRQYARQRQIYSFVARCGGSLPAYCPGHPELYVLAKKGDGRLAVGLWNAFPDRIVSPEVKLDGIYSAVSCFGCAAELSGDTVRLGDIPAYEFAFIELS